MGSGKAARAATLFENFTGHPGEVIGRVDIPADDVLTVFGECEAIAYSTTRDGIKESYQHEFRKRSRPLIAVSSDGRRLYLLAGAYEFTSHGIEDR